MLHNLQTSVSLLLISIGLCLALLLSSLLLPKQDKTQIPVEEGWFCGNVILDAQSGVTDSTYLAGEKIWKSNCASCHSFAKKVIGPQMAGISGRRDSLWIVQSILNYAVLLKAKDSTAVQLFAKYREIRHPAFEYIGDEDFKLLMRFLMTESKIGYYSKP